VHSLRGYRERCKCRRNSKILDLIPSLRIHTMSTIQHLDEFSISTNSARTSSCFPRHRHTLADHHPSSYTHCEIIFELPNRITCHGIVPAKEQCQWCIVAISNRRGYEETVQTQWRGRQVDSILCRLGCL